MENQNFIEKLAAQFGQSASVRNVYGEPIRAGDKTIIPVAQIAFGLGGGYGRGKKNKMKPLTNFEEGRTNDGEGTRGEGAGGGGGMYARPRGVYEITPTATRFIPANNNRHILLGLAIGFVLRGWLRRKKRR